MGSGVITNKSCCIKKCNLYRRRKLYNPQSCAVEFSGLELISNGQKLCPFFTSFLFIYLLFSLLILSFMWELLWETRWQTSWCPIIAGCNKRGVLLIIPVMTNSALSPVVLSGCLCSVWAPVSLVPLQRYHRFIHLHPQTAHRHLFPGPLSAHLELWDQVSSALLKRQGVVLLLYCVS